MISDHDKSYLNTQNRIVKTNTRSCPALHKIIHKFDLKPGTGVGIKNFKPAHHRQIRTSQPNLARSLPSSNSFFIALGMIPQVSSDISSGPSMVYVLPEHDGACVWGKEIAQIRQTLTNRRIQLFESRKRQISRPGAG